eukprot:5779723-Prymnesium_polylepis.1
MTGAHFGVLRWGPLLESSESPGCREVTHRHQLVANVPHQHRCQPVLNLPRTMHLAQRNQHRVGWSIPHRFQPATVEVYAAYLHRQDDWERRCDKRTLGHRYRDCGKGLDCAECVSCKRRGSQHV